MKKLLWGMLLAVLVLAAGQVRATDAAVENVATEQSHYKTVAVIENVTDPANPVELWRGSNVLTMCGVRALLAYGTLFEGTTSMGSATGNAAVCTGTNANGEAKIACPFNGNATINVGAGNTADCTGANTPYQCCTGSGTGCTIWAGDTQLFAQKQPNQSNTNVETLLLTWVTDGSPGATALALDSGYPDPHFDGTTTSGVIYRATAGSSVANHKWCEWGVRSDPGAGCGLATTGGYRPGWLLNHAAITGTACSSGKSSGATWQITVTVTIA